MKTAVKKRRGLRQEQRELAQTMRAAGRTWVEIAAVFRDRYGLNARTALRLVRGWSQPEAADQWTRLWPDDPKTLKNISYWENWPSSTGREPSIPVLSRLAQLYQCAITDLLIDGPDFRHLDAAHTRRAGHPMPAVEELAQIDAVLDRLAETDVERVAGMALVWAQRLRPIGYAYGVLMKLSAALALAATAHSGLSRVPDPDAADEPEPPIELRPWPTGIWRTRYDDGGTPVEYHVVLRRHRERLVGQSLPHPGGSRVRLELDIDGSEVNGSWAEYVAEGVPVYRTVRLAVGRSRHSMRGQWVGFDGAGRVTGGEWEMSFVDHSVSGRALRTYRGTAA